MAIRAFSFWFLLLGTTFAQTPQPIGTASISGKVTIEGKPAPGITVRIQKSDEQWDNSKAPSVVTTDSDGGFRLDKLPAAQYLVTPSAPGYYNPQKKTEWQEGLTTNLGDGEHASGQDFALKRGAVVTGRLFDANGRAIIEQQVVLKKIGGSNKAQIVQCTEYSDDRGVYRCYGLEPGQYLVGAGTDPKENAVLMIGARYYVRTWYPGVAQEEQATPVEVTIEKEASGIDLRLERKKKGFKVMGRVMDADTGKPVPNILVALGTVNDEGLTTGYSMGGGSGSNADGEFKLEGITNGKYRAIPQTYSGEEYFADPVTFEVDNDDVTSLEIKMRKGATIQGTAVLEEGASPEAQRKLVGVSLVARARDPQAQETDWYSTSNSLSRIDAAGNVQFKGVRNGNVTINLNGKEAKGFSIRRIERDGAPITDGLQVNAGETITGLRIVLALGSGTIRGEIKVEGGTLPEDVGLRIRAKTTNKTQGDGWGNIDARGKFLIENLNSGSYELVVETFMNRPPFGNPPVTLQPHAKTVQVTNGQEQTVNLTVTIGSTSKEEKQ
jgi:5-hydroxyisourate hydrolase-like protein (transthyretin family)